MNQPGVMTSLESFRLNSDPNYRTLASWLVYNSGSFSHRDPGPGFVPFQPVKVKPLHPRTWGCSKYRVFIRCFQHLLKTIIALSGFRGLEEPIHSLSAATAANPWPDARA